MAKSGAIRVGIGGWTFEPWRGSFYPDGLAQKSELDYASRHVTAIEINGTFYGTQKPESFAKWHDETPDDFVFALKGPRFSTNRRVLAEAGPSIERFVGSGIVRLKAKLGPINWQMAATKAYQPDDFEAFLALLPKEVEGIALRHVVEVRHQSFMTPDFPALLARYGVAAVFADEPDYPYFFDPTADFVYVRLQCAREEEPAGYPPQVLDTWARHAGVWTAGGMPEDLPRIDPKRRVNKTPRDVFVFMINGFKPKAPFAAMALIERLKG
ncbi:DUF72 domain-containing protein [Phreatobacter cathodiphilus]|uniref:DUF72 domain-containing protein n=1 Tax=Phreatobacter cathodiphilus TaxID=1868589 RepID=A0A2S0NHQ0_9HYPH|nr:DUF72 domain-containing protein [Phreatobacter cathodiphilus]AVO47679.1 DUF72 domain-containing protein [Phreatobacter cathodiphilus]